MCPFRNSLYANDPDAKCSMPVFSKEIHDQVMVAAKDNMGWTATMVNKDAKIRNVSFGCSLPEHTGGHN